MRLGVMKAALAAACATLATGAGVAGSLGAGPAAAVAVAPAALPDLERACAASAARLTSAPPASVYVQGRVSGSTPPTVQLWAGGGHWLCSPVGDGRVGFRPKPRGLGVGFQNVQMIR